ncbi:hypothetical protein AV530_009125 [Patagioenas fasciata monilis]|uniref:PDZ domain-containing protein n=1 Tax=Patagioenas fasciata monilis TaxID=372326 RepID=A0A1V4L186_PATFA|nr:hypothetical protein AV530_009125 [Patagioenas fasciata monilis]
MHSPPPPSHGDSPPEEPPPRTPLPRGLEDQYPIEEIQLVKAGGPLGLSIVGGSDHSSHPFGIHEPGVFISKVRPAWALPGDRSLGLGRGILIQEPKKCVQNREAGHVLSSKKCTSVQPGLGFCIWKERRAVPLLQHFSLKGGDFGKDKLVTVKEPECEFLVQNRHPLPGRVIRDKEGHKTCFGSAG